MSFFTDFHLFLHWSPLQKNVLKLKKNGRHLTILNGKPTIYQFVDIRYGKKLLSIQFYCTKYPYAML